MGDKCCYSPDTEVLTRKGWKPFTLLTEHDEVASLDPEKGCVEYQKPESVFKFKLGPDDKMYHVSGTFIDLLVTDNHRLFVRDETGSKFSLREAKDVFGKKVEYLKHACSAKGLYPNHISLPLRNASGSAAISDIVMDSVDYLRLLGMFLACGRLGDFESGEIFFDFRQRPHVFKSVWEDGAPRQVMDLCETLLDPWNFASADIIEAEKTVRVCSPALYDSFNNLPRDYGAGDTYLIPDWVFELDSTSCSGLLHSLFEYGGEGWPLGAPDQQGFSIWETRSSVYVTFSKVLADQIQHLALLSSYVYADVSDLNKGLGAMHNPKHNDSAFHNCFSLGHKGKQPYIVTAMRAERGSALKYSDDPELKESMEPARDFAYVYCASLPKHHILYVRRNGKAVWCGNSTRYGLKGICGAIIPTDKMPRNPVTNEPFDVLLNPMTILSRVAPNQLMEIGLGKAAKRTGVPYRLPQLPPKEGWAQWTLDQMAQAGVPEKEDIFDPETGKTIPGIMTGYMYTLPFHHLSEKKLSGRGSSAVSYSSDELPVKGGGEGAQAKRMSMMDNTALVCHGALDVLKDAQVVRGSKNEDYWKALKLGRPLPEPQVPFVYNKFINLMKAGGINVMKRGSNNLDLLPMTDKDIEQLSGGAISDAQMIDNDMNPIANGLFDTAKAGGLLGKKWTHIDLSEPLPNPVFEEPIRRLLGLSQTQFRDILSGREDLNGEYGGKAFQKALSGIDVDKEIARQKQILSSSKSSKRDNAVKCLGYLTALKKQNLSPKDWIITKVPVLPPVFRPVSRLGDTLLSADINELYRDVLESSKSLAALRKDLPDKDLKDERETLYEAVQAAFGLGDPITPEGAAKGLKGALRTITGNGSPKFGFYQSRVLSKPMDMVGRGAIAPNPNLDMDTIGIPEDKAWELYKDFILRRLTRNNVPGLRALEMIEKRDPAARRALEDEMRSRPVLMDRAPTWHKFNLLAYQPFMTRGSVVRVSPLVLAGCNGDFDGDYQKNIVFVGISAKVLPQIKAQFETLGRGESIMAETKRGQSTVLVKEKFTVYPVDLQDFPHGKLIGRRRDAKYDIDFYEVPKGIHVFAYDERTRKIVMAEVAGWSVHRDKAVEIVTLSGGEQIYTDDDPRGIYGLDPEGGFGFELSRMTPSEALERKVLVPVSSQVLVPLHANLKVDPKTLAISQEAGIGMDWNFGYVSGVVAVRGPEPGREVLRESLEEACKNAGIKKNVLSSLGLAMYAEDASERHLPGWFHSGDREFLEGLACGLLAACGSVSYNTSGREKPELLISMTSNSLRLMREARRVFRLLGVHASVSFSKVTEAGNKNWILSVSSVGVKRSGIFKRLPLQEMRETILHADIDLSDESSKNDFIPVPKSARCLLTRWISQKHHCNLYHTIFESCKRGGYVTRSCGFRIKEIAEKMQKRYSDDFEKAQNVLDDLLQEHGQDTEAFKVPDWVKPVILAGIEGVQPYSAYGAGDEKTKEARRLARSLDNPVFPDVLTGLARYFNRHVPSQGLLAEPQYQMFVKMLESPVTWHRVVKVEKTGIVETGYDLTVPGYETFMSTEGVILSNTVNFHVPVSEAAVKNAYEKMLPSKNLISLTDLRESMQNPRQEMALGLYALTRPASKKPPVRFRTAEEAKQAYRKGLIKANDPIIVG